MIAEKPGNIFVKPRKSRWLDPSIPEALIDRQDPSQPPLVNPWRELFPGGKPSPRIAVRLKHSSSEDSSCAQSVRWQVRTIETDPGVSESETPPQKPRHELVITTTAGSTSLITQISIDGYITSQRFFATGESEESAVSVSTTCDPALLAMFPRGSRPIKSIDEFLERWLSSASREIGSPRRPTAPPMPGFQSTIKRYEDRIFGGLYRKAVYELRGGSNSGQIIRVIYSCDENSPRKEPIVRRVAIDNWWENITQRIEIVHPEISRARDAFQRGVTKGCLPESEQTLPDEITTASKKLLAQKGFECITSYYRDELYTDHRYVEDTYRRRPPGSIFARLISPLFPKLHKRGGGPLFCALYDRDAGDALARISMDSGFENSSEEYVAIKNPSPPVPPFTCSNKIAFNELSPDWHERQRIEILPADRWESILTEMTKPKVSLIDALVVELKERRKKSGEEIPRLQVPLTFGPKRKKQPKAQND